MKAATGLLVAAALLSAPDAAADPEIHEPYCTEGQMPTTGECLPAPGEANVNNAPVNDAPGTDPDVAVGLDPESVPVI